ncbi:MAG: O-antigen ligase family protein [Burkholderiales bacterium]|nr:O-antigen ligase family protein [Burkholderiales bacterium]MCW5603472.1 O-antigen ligase family protein [Burkholderiales bacterium]
MNAFAFPRHADRAGRWAAIALGASIPVSVALDNLLLLVVLAGWLLGGQWAEKRAAARNAVAICALLLFGLLLLGMLWGDQPGADARTYLLKYLDLAFIPLFAYFFRKAGTRRIGLWTLAGSLMVTLLLSFLIRFGVIEHGGFIEGTPLSPVVFKLRITHGLLMAFAAYLFALMALEARINRDRAIWGTLALLAAINVTLMVEGATGHVVLGLLTLLLILVRLSARMAVLAVVALFSVSAVLTVVPGPLSKRVATLVEEVRNRTPEAAAPDSSAGLRIEFYRNTLAIVADHPLTGVGTGGFPSAYAERVQGSRMVATRNPHNEYLHIAAQIGLIGLAAMLALFVVQWRTAPRLPTRLETDLARGLVVTIAAGCLFNSFLLDHAEGLFFAWLTGLLYAGLKSDKS